MTAIVDFLRARIAEDDERDQPGNIRAQAETEAKRRIVTEHTVDGNDDHPMCHHLADEPCVTLRALAAVYADHSDYREGWRL